ncbi:unnamed protein product [Vitrella brassicaformis CCMP3155]|uniref:Uncharacterized protein n=1 Tax=Vitrella brassicaformis (strain CCMP3155) TaxID=1169540 RepID=A0A0G4E951_VITBC|nr:unnamed protein product [Vitrella brassicaformis CCMP3155]|eukprot:CEL92079.1 unnamed protein product [Vitrella brassicaformis CCMP3155]
MATPTDPETLVFLASRRLESAASPEYTMTSAMKHDPEHYDRAYMLCRGMGSPHSQCTGLPVDTYITPQHPLYKEFRSELLSGMDCMTEHRDESKCHHFTEGLYKKLTWKAPEPTTTQKAATFLGKLVGIKPQPTS